MKKDLQISELCDVYGDLLTERQKDFLTSYYDFDLSLTEISENYGITRQAVRDTLVKAAEQLENYEKKIGALAQKERIAQLMDELISCIDNGRLEQAKAIACFVGKNQEI